MKYSIKKAKNILNGTIGWSHNGKDGGYCEAGETVKIKWQPDAGWGLLEAHYTPDGSDPVVIENGEFTMPSANITIGATFKKFVISDWTSGKDAAENAGKVLGFDEGGNLVPVDGGVSVAGENGYVILSDGNGGLVANARVNVNSNGEVFVNHMYADSDVNAGANVNAKGEVNSVGDMYAGGNVSVEGFLQLKDTVSGNYYKVEVTNGQLVVTAV